MQAPILLIASTTLASRLAASLEHELDYAVEHAASRRAGLAALRRKEYLLILLDEDLASEEQQLTHTIYQKALATPVLEVRFSAESNERTLRQARAALARRAQDQALALQAAAAALQSELRSSLTGLLLESQLALREALPFQQHKLRQVVELASNLRDRLSAHA